MSKETDKQTEELALGVSPKPVRRAVIKRNTKETKISVELTLDGRGQYENHTGCGFLDHMLDLFARHGRFDLTVKCNGDTWVDDHHTVEDIGITLGAAFLEGLGDKAGICRYGNAFVPMDEALVLCALDLSGRDCLTFDGKMPTEKVGDFDTQLVKEFFLGFCRSLGLTMHIKEFAGENSHHIIEAMFKAVGRALSQAVAIDLNYRDEIPSTKGVL